MKKLIYIHGQKEDPNVQHITFPTGEKHIRITGLTPADQVILCYNDPSGDVMKLGMAVDICRRANISWLSLVMPFVPYARQDRVAVDGDPFSIQVFAKFINSFELPKVIITDPHSEVTPALLNNVVIIHQHEIASRAVLSLDGFVTYPIALVAPDIGAAKKIKALQTHLATSERMTYPVIQCDKTRCPTTGKITGFKILDGDPAGHHCLMVDDIADGAATFVGLSDVIKRAGAAGQSLYVTHGIFSKGIKALHGRFDFIYTSDSFPKTPGTYTLEGVYS